MKKRDLRKQLQKLDDGLNVEDCLKEIEERIELVDYHTSLNTNTIAKKKMIRAPVKYCLVGLITVLIVGPTAYFSSVLINKSPTGTLEKIMKTEFKYWTEVEKVFLSKNEIIYLNYAQKNMKNYYVLYSPTKLSESVLVKSFDKNLEMTDENKIFFMELPDSSSVELTVYYKNNLVKHISFDTPSYIEYIYHSFSDDQDKLLRP